MSLKLAQRQNLRDLLVCGELTPPRSDSSEPSLSPAPAPLSPPSPSSIKDDPDVLQNVDATVLTNQSMRDHTRLTLCGFMLLFLAFNPLGFVINNIERFNSDYINTKLDGRTILNYQGINNIIIIIIYYYNNNYILYYYNVIIITYNE